MHALIAGFLLDTAAVVPVRNPAYDPNAKAAATPKGKTKTKNKAPAVAPGAGPKLD